MKNENEDLKNFLLNEEEKRIYFKLKLKSKLDRCYIIALRSFLDFKGIKEYLYSDDEILYCLIKGRKLCSK